MKFLLVEDDRALADAIEQLLSEHRYVMDLATDGIMGKNMAEAFPYDLILLDWVLPKLDGIALCKHLRSEGNYTPIVLMTARDASSDKVAGLDAGADDYIVKPFEFEELLARIRALLRRAEGLASPVLQWGDLCLDPRSSEVSCRNMPIAVTPKEYALLELFLRNPKRIFSLDNLLDKIWMYDDAPTVGSVRTHIKGLRQKLRQVGLTEVITTVYGLGYRLNSEPSQTLMPLSDCSSTLEKEQHTSKVTDSIDIAALWKPVSQGYIQRVSNVANTLRGLHLGLVDKSVREKILAEAHALAGSLGSFGFGLATLQCREIERILQANAYLSAEHISQLEAAITQTQQILAQGIAKRGTIIEPITSSSDLSPASATPHSSLLSRYIELQPDQSFQLLMVARADKTKRAWLGALEEAASRYRVQGYRVEVWIVESIAQAREAIFSESASPPHVVALGLDGSGDLMDKNSDEFDLIAELQSAQPPIHSIVLTASASFENRVSVARMGVKSLLQMPVMPTELLEAVASVLGKGVSPTAKILVVDDDPAMLSLLQSLLQPWGLRLQFLGVPKDFWKVLEDFEPDLVLLDVKMPQINGFELCQVMRNAARWHEIPVIFMSGYTDADTIERVFSAGADDYIRKPIVAPELVGRVLGWLERSRDRQLMANVDSLTGVYNRQRSAQMLNQLMDLAQRRGQTLCFAIIDLDNFKKINNDYGHAEGDQVLKRFGEKLQSTFRDENVVARWGGEEFVVGLYGVSRQEGVCRLRQFWQTWRMEEFAASMASAVEVKNTSTLNTSIFKVTFSAGVAVYPHDAADLQQLYRAADKELSKAKEGGCDRISA